MKTAAFIFGLVFISCKFKQITTEGQLEETVVQSECRDRYLWIHVASRQTPRFEAVDGNGVHSISEQLASRCGYTISTFKMDGFTTFRASYYSCFTHNQNDKVFTFSFNVMVNDAGGQWISKPVSAVCSGLTWTHREIICEEDYMEVNVNRQSTCGGEGSGQMWQAAFAQVQKLAGSVWQLMFLQSDGQVSSMSISEAQRSGYSLTSSAQRVVLRSKYKQPHSEVEMLEGIPTEVVRVSLFFKQKLMVVMIDVSMACTVNSGSFDGAQLLWDIPRFLRPLVGEEAGFESRSHSLGVEGLLLDESSAAARGFSVVQKGHLIQIGVPFGAEGGYRKSLVVNNVYKEMYVIFLMYEHVFSLLYEDGTHIDTKHRMLRVLDTPLLCSPPFSIDQTISDDQVFSVYLGNIPADVMLEDIWVNGKQLMMSTSAERGYSISPVVHANGSRAYTLQLPFEDAIVNWMYLGQGVVQYSIDMNFTLTIMPQRDSYYHHTIVTAQVFNAFPPEITARCLDGGIIFSVVKPPGAKGLWELGVDHEPITPELAAQRGYLLYNDAERTTLEVPVLSIGYHYEGINLSNFYGTFKLLLRDSKTLEVQTSTSKRCLFKTQDMIICSADGTMTVVATPASTWPTVHPERTTLLDSTCGPKQTDGYRVLFEFRLDSCGTRAMVGELYVVYENEILHDRQLIADGPNFISRESQFKLTVRCFYPLNGVNRLSVDRIFTSGAPGYGSVNVFKNVKDSENKPAAQECLHQVLGNTVNTPTHHVHQTPAAVGVRPQPKPESSHFNPSPPEGPTTYTRQIPLQASPHPGHHMSQTQNQHESGSPTGDPLPNFTPTYDQLLDISLQVSNLSAPSLNFVVRGENLGLTAASPALGSGSSSKIPDSPVVGQFQIDSGSSGETLPHGLNGLGDNVRDSGLTWNQLTPGPLQPSLNVDLGMQTVTQQNEVKMDFNLYGSSRGMGSEVTEESSLPQSRFDASQSSLLHPVLQQQAHYSPGLPTRDKTYVPATIKHITSQNTDSNLSVGTQGSVSSDYAYSQVNPNLERTGSVERRNTEMVHSRVQNIRVKPASKLFSSGHNQKPFVKHTNRTRWSPQEVPEHRGSNMRQEHMPERRGVSILSQEQGVHSVVVKSEPNAAIHHNVLSPNQQMHKQKPVHPSVNEQKLVQSVAETGNGGRRASASTLRTVPQPAGASLIRVRPVPGLSPRLLTHDELNVENLQNPTPSRTSYRSLTPKSNSPVGIREHQTNNLSPGRDGLTGFYTGPISSGSSDHNSHTTSDCSGHYGASNHQGIVRGKQISQ